MKLDKNFTLPDLFMGNFFCLIPNTDLAFVVISKNACTFLKQVALLNETGQWLEGFDLIHNSVGYSKKSKYLVDVKEMADFEKTNGKRLKFAVWRDPIERLTSTYKQYCLEREYRQYFHYLGINEYVSLERYIQFVTFEIGKSNPLNQDEHIRRQCDYYKSKNVNRIIPMQGINQFLTSEGVFFRDVISNKTVAEIEPFASKDLDIIRDLYKRDYDIKFR